MSKYNLKFLKKAHKESIYHEIKILKSQLCGCFHCEKIFEPKEIKKWTDEHSKIGRTAMCPVCGIDAVLDDTFPIVDEVFLKEMNKFWF